MSTREEVGFLEGLLRILGTSTSAQIGREIVEDDVPAYIRYKMGARISMNMVTHVELRNVFIPLAYFAVQLYQRCQDSKDVYCSVVTPERISEGTLKSYCRTSFSTVAALGRALGGDCCKPFEFQHGMFPYNDGRDPTQPASGGRGHLYASSECPIVFMYEPVSQEATISFRWLRTRWVKDPDGSFREEFSIQPQESAEDLTDLPPLPSAPPGAPPRPDMSPIDESHPLRSIVPQGITGMEARAEIHVRRAFSVQLLALIIMKNIEYDEEIAALFRSTLTEWHILGNDPCGIRLPPPAYGATSRCLTDAILAHLHCGDPAVAVLPHLLSPEELLVEWEPRLTEFLLQLLEAVKDCKHDLRMEALFKKTLLSFSNFSARMSAAADTAEMSPPPERKKLQ